MVLKSMRTLLLSTLICALAMQPHNTSQTLPRHKHHYDANLAPQTTIASIAIELLNSISIMSSFNSTVGRSSSRKKEQSSSIEPFPLYHNHLPRPRSESRSSRTISPLPKLESRSSRNSSPLLKPEPRSVDTLAPFRTPSPSWLVRQAYPPVYIPKRDPMVRESGETKWPSGVLSGGRIIDMMESLSSTGKVNDYALVLWLQEHYVVPFGRIERLDGLVVTDKEDL